jgi:hypothetical protein
MKTWELKFRKHLISKILCHNTIRKIFIHRLHDITEQISLDNVIFEGREKGILSIRSVLKL